MSIETKIVVDQITILENWVILYREAKIVFDGDVILSKTFHRNSIRPNEELNNVPEKVASIAKAAWTEQAVMEYEASKQKEQL